MRTGKKKETRVKARMEEDNVFVISEDDSYEDVDDETNLNFVVNQIDHTTKKRKREVTEKNKKGRKKNHGDSDVARAGSYKTNGLSPEDECDAPTDVSKNHITQVLMSLIASRVVTIVV